MYLSLSIKITFSFNRVWWICCSLSKPGFSFWCLGKISNFFPFLILIRIKELFIIKKNFFLPTFIQCDTIYGLSSMWEHVCVLVHGCVLTVNLYVYVCPYVIFWPSTQPKNAIPRWYTGRKWHIPMASNRKRSRGRIKAYDMGQGEGLIVPLQWCTGRE